MVKKRKTTPGPATRKVAVGAKGKAAGATVAKVVG